MPMTPKDRIYWEGIVKANQQTQDPEPPSSLEETMQFLNSAYRVMKELNPDALKQEPTEIELYKKWMTIQKKKKSST